MLFWGGEHNSHAVVSRFSPQQGIRKEMLDNLIFIPSETNIPCCYDGTITAGHPL